MFKKGFKRKGLARRFLYFLRTTDPIRIEFTSKKTSFALKAFYADGEFVEILLINGTQGCRITSKEFYNTEYAYTGNEYWFYYCDTDLQTIKHAFTPSVVADEEYKLYLREFLKKM